MSSATTIPVQVQNSQLNNTDLKSMSSEETKVSPWGQVNSPTPCSLSEVMSEELATELQSQNEDTFQQVEPEVDLSQFLTADELDTSNDLLLAQMLQHEFDREFDKEIKIKEDKLNSQSKVKVSYQNYRAVHPSLWEEDQSDEEIEELPDRKEEQRNFRGRGVSGKGKNIVTKHDPTICGRRNANRAMEQFPPEVNTGDGIGMDMKLPNRVYNKLKIHSMGENKRSHRLHEKKEHSTAEHAMDPKTRLILYKLVNSGILDDVNGVISTGKESVVFHAQAGSSVDVKNDGKDDKLTQEMAIKVFKTVLTDFKNRADYMKGDVRFFKDEFKKQNPRKIMGLWADKEVYNLRLMAKYGIPCPRVVLLRKHVLIMSFIGKDQVAAPKLKDAKLGPVEAQMAYDQCVQNMKKMYRECQLVHADLSEYNMLWHNDTLYMIDVSQAVDRMHPHAHEFLLRDCRNVTQFFKKLGVEDVPSEYTLFNDITGLGLEGEGHHFLIQVEEYEKNEEKLRSGNSTKNYPFDFFFERAQRERESQKSASQNENDQNTEITGPGDSSPPECDEEFEELYSSSDDSDTGFEFINASDLVDRMEELKERSDHDKLEADQGNDN